MLAFREDFMKISPIVAVESFRRSAFSRQHSTPEIGVDEWASVSFTFSKFGLYMGRKGFQKVVSRVMQLRCDFATCVSRGALMFPHVLFFPSKERAGIMFSHVDLMFGGPRLEI